MSGHPARLTVAVLTIAFGAWARADVTPHALISDGMVLQQESRVKLRGTAEPGENITVRFRGQEASVVAGEDGTWSVPIDSQRAGGPFALTIAGKTTIAFKDVLVGEVWLCAGESNMEDVLHNSTGGEEAIANSSNPKLRLFTVPHGSRETPQEDVSGHWVASGPATTRNFSALGYWFGSKLQKALGVPVGLIQASYSGTNLEAWISQPALEALPKPIDRYADIARVKTEYAAALAKYQAAEAKSAKEAATIRKGAGAGAGARATTARPTKPGPLRGPSMVYNGMIAPLLNYPIRGVVLSQGESNGDVGRAGTYGTLFPVLIEQWRTDWGLGDIPFVFVQIAPIRAREPAPNVPSGIAEVREAQRVTALRVPNTAMVTTTDLGDANGDIHNKRKEPAAKRLTLAALAVAYGRPEEYSGPLYDGMTVKANKAVIRFTHADSGLASRGGTLTGFTIAGADRRFVTAEAEIEGDNVLVSSPKVPSPVAVRYGWADFPVVNLWNKDGFPASPFRTDDFSLVPPKPSSTPRKKSSTAPDTKKKAAVPARKSASPGKSEKESLREPPGSQDSGKR